MRYLGLAGLAILASCGTPMTSGGVIVRLSTSQPSITVQESAELTLTVSNPTSRTVRVNFSACPAYALLDAQGQLVATRSLVCNAVLILGDIRPGQSMERKGQLRASEWSSSGSLAPGRYTVRAQVTVEGDVVFASHAIEITPAND